MFNSSRLIDIFTAIAAPLIKENLPKYTKPMFKELNDIQDMFLGISGDKASPAETKPEYTDKQKSQILATLGESGGFKSLNDILQKIQQLTK